MLLRLWFVYHDLHFDVYSLLFIIQSVPTITLALQYEVCSASNGYIAYCMVNFSL